MGELNLTNRLEDIFGLLIASDELLFEKLSEHVQDHLVEEHTGWIQENLKMVTNTVFKLANCEKLQDYCLRSICVDPQSFIPLLDHDILFVILEKDDLPIEEIVIWDCLIKWAIEHTSG